MVRNFSHTDLITIDGSAGEGGGQVLRTSLGLSLVTGRAFCIEKIRARRKKPGLLRQHLTAVRAAAQIGRAEIDGAEIGSGKLTFTPGEIRPGEYRFAVGTAGSATLVLQTVLPALTTAAATSKLTLEGGTHNPWAPPFDFLEKAFLPIVRCMGPVVEATLVRPGFYPAGGGVFHVTIEPERSLQRIDLPERGQIVSRHVRALVSRLPIKIAEREVNTIGKHTGWPDECFAVRNVDSPGPGNCVIVEIESEHVTEVFTGFGRKGIPAEKVAENLIREVERYLAADVPVGEHLADQLLVPMALAGGGSFETLTPSLHTQTNVEVIRRFLDVEICTEEIDEDVWQVTIAGAPSTDRTLGDRG